MDYLYICDIEKNRECSKEECVVNGGCCMRTTDEHYAKNPPEKRKFVEMDGGGAMKEVEE